MSRSIALLFSLLTALSAGAAALASPASGIRIDGRLDEAAWQKAPENSGFSLLQGGSPRFGTSFRLLSDRENLWIGIRCEKANMDQVKAAAAGVSECPDWADDLVEICFAPTGRPDQYYQFVIGAGNAGYQMYYGERGVIRPDEYAPFYEHQVHRGKDFYSVELRIPLTGLYMTPAKFMSTDWLFNIGRRNRVPEEQSSWSPQVKNFRDSDHFRKISSMPVKPAEQDIYIKELFTNLKHAKSGDLIVRIEVSGQAAGTYTLALQSPFLRNALPREVNLHEGENYITLSEVGFLKSGRLPAAVTLTDSSKKFTAGRHYRIPVEFSPYSLKLSSPYYNQSFYPGQKADRLTGVMDISIPADQLRISLKDKKTVIAVRNNQGKFDLPLRLPAGDTVPVKFEILKDGRVVGTENADIRHLKPTGHTMVWMEKPGLISVNGKKIFAYSWYCGNTWVTSNWIFERYPKMDSKHKVNFQETVNLQPSRLVPGIIEKEGRKDGMPSQKLFDAYRRKIEANRKENFYSYYLCDEPECHGVSPVYLRHLYQFVKKLDPGHLVMIITRTPGRYVDCADILSPHPYLSPIIDKNGKRQLYSEVDTFRRMCDEVTMKNRPNKIIMVTPQVFSYGFLNAQADYTTFDETNASIWSSVCHGALGVCPYIWHGQFCRPDLRYGIDYIYNSLERLEPFLLSGETPLPVTSANSWIDVRGFSSGSSQMLAVVNVSSAPRDTVIRRRTPVSADWHVFRESRAVSFSGNDLKLSLAPYQVMILTTDVRDRDMGTLAQLRSTIAKAEYERTHRGNILFGHHREIEISHSHCGYMYTSRMEQQDTLFDGVVDAMAWQPHRYKELWYELSFPTFVPRFRRIKIWGNALKGMKLQIWKFGRWREFPATVKEDRWSREYDFGKTLSTVKIRMDFVIPPSGRENRLELYEFEMFK